MNKILLDMIINCSFILASFFALIYALDNLMNKELQINNLTLKTILVFLIYIVIMAIFIKKRIPLNSPIIKKELQKKIKFFLIVTVSSIIIIGIMLISGI